MALEYDVKAMQVVPGVSTARAEEAQISFDSSPDDTPRLVNPTELLLSASGGIVAKRPWETLEEG